MIVHGCSIPLIWDEGVEKLVFLLLSIGPNGRFRRHIRNAGRFMLSGNLFEHLLLTPNKLNSYVKFRIIREVLPFPRGKTPHPSASVGSVSLSSVTYFFPRCDSKQRLVVSSHPTRH